ncbi:MAG: tripartite tricarboxylate transporter substrate binding protein [Polaromonas sp.]|uniref:Bug family tripartite tricarboxylate transporter substrate binding protein n=1 Tax=Polaromonas sp. TaxID=1869339 RepID=UPI0025FF9F69|nr:tripartite tricarboxylate transporter substrate binding protein [Polaromonas sp.]MBI2728959.1 tripartite tricarboxylate transporter substrate binding protein [Polaromonas sp.]
MINRRQTLAVAASATLGTSLNAFSQTGKWPSKPIRVIVPFAPAGAVDLLSRFLGEKLGAELGQTFLIDNRPGAGGNIGTEMVVRAGGDGYTLLIAGSPTHVINPYLYKNLSYNPVKDLSQVALIASAPNLLVVNPGLGLGSVEDLVKLARSKPGQISFSSAGNGTSGHLAGELLRSQARIDVMHVPYKGQADAITAVIRGEVAFAFVAIPGTLALVKDGRIKAIAVTSAARSALVPELPTVTQAGYRDFEVLAWYCMSAPAGVPAPIVAKLASEIDKLLQQPATKDKLMSLGMEPNFKKGPDFISYMAKESAKWGKVIKDANIVAS